MNKFKNLRIIIGCVALFICMLTATFVFAKDNGSVVKKSYYVEKAANNNSVVKPVEYVTSVNKEVTINHRTNQYRLEIENGNVVLTNFAKGTQKTVYGKGNAKYLAEVNLYYHNAVYTLMVTDDGKLYANVYRNNEENVVFRLIKLDESVASLRIEEDDLGAFHDYPGVKIYSVHQDGKTEIVKL